jgi:DNA mismatch endonuclease, patch repair protein
MADIVDQVTRSRMMSGIRGKDTRPELAIRKGLHALGFRYRLHVRQLHGRPDLVLAKYHAAIFIHGCFWHGHNCPLFKWPNTRKDFWRQKIEGNVARDDRAVTALLASGWRVAVVWECSLRGEAKTASTVKELAHWLQTEVNYFPN